MAASPNGSVYHCGSYAVFMSFHAYYTLERCSNTAQPPPIAYVPTALHKLLYPTFNFQYDQ